MEFKPYRISSKLGHVIIQKFLSRKDKSKTTVKLRLGFVFRLGSPVCFFEREKEKKRETEKKREREKQREREREFAKSELQNWANKDDR